MLAYKAKGQEPLTSIIAHSLRGASASLACRLFPSLEAVCVVATQKLIHSFTKHYQIDKLV